MRALDAFLNGALAAGFAVCALFFAAFRGRTGDRLFAYLEVAFVCFAAERTSALIAIETGRTPLWTYVLRLAGFVVIIVALIEKNREPRQGGANRSSHRS